MRALLKNEIISYEYDDFNRLISKIKGDKKYNYYYNDIGDLTKILYDYDKIKYTYDFDGKLIEYKCNDLAIKYIYDSNDNIVEKRYYYNNELQNVINFDINENNYISSVRVDDNIISLTYDELNRIVNKNLNQKFDTKYSFFDNGYRASYITNEIIYNDDKYYYNFDKLLCLKSLYKNNDLQVKYSYDIFNQLIETKDYKNNILEKYYYNDHGNIISVMKYNLDDYSFISKDTYEYNDSVFVDKLTKFNNDTIEYNLIGNPTKIGENISFIWNNGKELTSFTKNDIETTYEYDDSGNRIIKNCGTNKIRYYYESGEISIEDRSGTMIYYLRYIDGELFGFKYNNNIYLYKKNFYGDIIGLLNANGEVIADYEYDSWGRVISIIDENGNRITDETNPAIMNPFRYRGYYYDHESGMYNIGKRYYNPEFRRFINTDSQISDDFIGNNLYAYCGNNSTNCFDENGNSFRLILSGIIGGAIGTAKYVYDCKKEGKKVNKMYGVNHFIKGFIFGVSGAIGGAIGVLGTIVENITDSLIDIKEDKKNNIKISPTKEILKTNYRIGIDLVGGKYVSTFVGPKNGPDTKKFIDFPFSKTGRKILKEDIGSFVNSFVVNETLDLIYSTAYNASDSESTKQNRILEIDIPRTRDFENDYNVNMRIQINNR